MTWEKWQDAKLIAARLASCMLMSYGSCDGLHRYEDGMRTSAVGACSTNAEQS